MSTQRSWIEGGRFFNFKFVIDKCSVLLTSQHVRLWYPMVLLLRLVQPANINLRIDFVTWEKILENTTFSSNAHSTHTQHIVYHYIQCICKTACYLLKDITATIWLSFVLVDIHTLDRFAMYGKKLIWIVHTVPITNSKN